MVQAIKDRRTKVSTVLAVWVGGCLQDRRARDRKTFSKVAE